MSIRPTQVLRWWDVRNVYPAHAGATSVGAFSSVYDSNTSCCFVRYVQLFFEGGINVDINSCFLESLSCLLSKCECCSVLTCIDAGESHIHQGILMCPAGHPLLHAAIHKVMETRPSSLGSRQPGYMTFCRQMWDLLQSRSVSNLQIGQNALRDWGSV